MAKDNETLFNEIEDVARKLQKHYFDNERFFDNINGASCMDNTSGWTYDCFFVVNGHITGDRAKEELTWLYDAFDSLASLMERHGAGETGSARGIKHEIQYVWALSRSAAYKVKDIANNMNIPITNQFTLNVSN